MLCYSKFKYTLLRGNLSMNASTLAVSIFSVLLSQSAHVAAAENTRSVPSKTEVATCLILTTMNDEWHWVSFDLKENFDAESTIAPFEKKLRDTMTSSCSFLFEDWDTPSRELLNLRINQVCTDDAENKNPFLGDGLLTANKRLPYNEEGSKLDIQFELVNDV